MRDVLSEVYAVVMAMGEEWINRIPTDVWEDIIAKKNDSYNPIVSGDKALNEQGLVEDTITFISLLYSEYWCDTGEERASLLAVFGENKAEWQAKIAQTGSVRGLIRMTHKN